MIEVAAGIVTRQDGRILIAKRGPGRKNAHLWEFPGGKQEAGESIGNCLQRELREELSLRVQHVRELRSGEAQGIRFHFLRAEALNDPTATEHEDLRFVRPREMLGLPFCPADEPVARALALNDPPLRAFFWDFDGTLMDTYPMMTACLHNACLRMGFQPLEDAELLRLQKETLAYAIHTLADRARVDERALRAAYDLEAANADLTQVQPLPGIPEAMRTMLRAGGKHYLVTHRDLATVRAMLMNANLWDAFAGMITSDDGYPRKPAPDSCRALLQRYAIDPATAVMIGDRPLDIQAGQTAGMLGCLLDPEQRFSEVPSDLRVTAASALPELLLPAPILD